MMKMPAANSGFTLIELMVVLLLMGLLFSAVRLGLTSWLYQAKLESSAREIGSLVGMAVAEALRSGETLELVYDTENQKFYFQKPGEEEQGQLSDAPLKADLGDSSEEDGSGEEPSPLTTEVLRIRRLPKGVKFKDIQTGTTKWEEPGQIKLTISPLGITSDHIVHLIDESGREFSVEYNSITSRVTFSEGYKEYETEDPLSTTQKGDF